MVTRLESSSSKLVPNLLFIKSLGHLQRDLQVSTFNSQIESSLLILDEMKSNLGISLLLEVTNNTLSDKVGSSDNLEDFIVVLSDKGELESILCWVDGDGSRLGTSVKAVDDVALDSGEVDGLFKGFDNAVITDCQLCRNRAAYPWGRAYLIWFKVV